MSTTVSMWLGIAFTLLAILATVLQAWLWSFPMEPDPGGPDPHGKTTAPTFWRYAHRVMGFAYVLIYVVLMIEMVPRLWEYQFELPARTVMHASMGILLGVLLCAKISILRWFQHFGGALPSIGLALLASTIILATLSIPFAVRAHDFGDAAAPENLERVKRVVSRLDFGSDVNPETLATAATLEAGQQVLTNKCTLCHDIRTILYKPRTGKGWYDSVRRMVKKPTMGPKLTQHDVITVTTYLIAITPDIQESVSLKKKKQKAQAVRAEKIKILTQEAAAAAKQDTKIEKPTVDTEKIKPVYEEKCGECHELSDVDKVGNLDRKEWTDMVNTMITEHEAELSEKEAADIIDYLVATKGK